MKNVFFIALLTITLVSCVKERPTDVGPDSIWTHYQLDFNQEDSVTTAKVITRFEENFGVKIQLHDATTLTFNGETLQWDPLEDWYILEIDSFIGAGEFKYVDIDARTFVNNVEILTANFPAELDTISRFTSYELEWGGPPIAADDNVIVTMYSLENSTIMQYFENAETATQVHMNIDFLQQFPNGHSRLEMQRRGVNSTVESPAVGGLVEWTYVPEDVVVYLE